MPGLAQVVVTKIIVPFPAAGATDIVGRIFSEALSRELDAPVVVVNKAGAGGAIGMRELVSSAPDGLTLAIATASTHAAIPATYKNPPYDVARDFTYISELARSPGVMVVRPSLPATNMAEFIRYARENPGKLSYGSPGVGSAGQFSAEIFKASTRTFMVHVPYTGGAAMMNELLGGHIDMALDNVVSALPHIRVGRLRALAVTWPKRLPMLPEVPTFEELSLPSNNRPAWFGLVGPAGVSPAVISTLNAAVKRVLDTAGVRERLELAGVFPTASTPGQFAQYVASETDLFRRTARSVNITLD